MASDLLHQLAASPDTAFFDIEADALLDKVTKIHCIVIRQGGVEYRYRDGQFQEGLLRLDLAPAIVGHNIIGYDIPAIRKVLGFPLGSKGRLVIDTLVLTRLAFPTLKELDWTNRPSFPEKSYGSHSLKAWGHRLGFLKGTFGEEDGAFDKWTQELEDYCARDVEVTEKLFRKMAEVNLPDLAVLYENELQTMISAQERWGFPFDIQGAQVLNAKIQTRRDELLSQLAATFPSKPAIPLAVYKRHQAKALELTGGKNPLDHVESLSGQGIKFKWKPEQPFNPASRAQVAERFMAMGWKPLEFTDGGAPKLSEEVLEFIGEHYPEGRPLAEFMMLEKRLGAISGGDNAWLKLVGDDGRMHGRCNTMGAVTFRFTHSEPNMTQVPSNGKPYGKECRALFHAPAGWKQVGCDVAGLELRMLGHYMSPFDGGEFIKVLLDGDIHTRNQQAAGLPTRNDAKTFIYAFLYGAGDVKLGTILHPKETSESKLKKAGKLLRQRFLAQTPALMKLTDLVQKKVAREKKLRAIDGRTLYVRSAHSALNTLLQSAGAIATKVATVEFKRLLEAQDLWMEQDWCLVAHVHDEWQTMCKEEYADTVAVTAIEAIKKAGVVLGFRCPLTGDYKIGQNWSETH